MTTTEVVEREEAADAHPSGNMEGSTGDGWGWM